MTTAEDKRKINNGTDEFDPFIVFILSYLSSVYLARKYIHTLVYSLILYCGSDLKKNQILILRRCQIGSILITLQLGYHGLQ